MPIIFNNRNGINRNSNSIPNRTSNNNCATRDNNSFTNSASNNNSAINNITAIVSESAWVKGTPTQIYLPSPNDLILSSWNTSFNNRETVRNSWANKTMDAINNDNTNANITDNNNGNFFCQDQNY